MHRLQIRCVIVVGYQNLGVDLGVSKLSVPTFLKISGARTISDLKPVSKGGNNFLPGNFYLNFYDSIGTSLIISNVDWINDPENVDAAIKKERWYSGKVQIGYNTAKGHWYLANDNNGKYPMDAFPINNGDGYLMKVASTHTAGVDMTYSGQVDDADTPIDIALGVSKLSGNVAPKTIKISDIVVTSKGGNNFLPGNFYLNFYDAIGNSLIISNVDWIKDPENVDAAIKKERWYSGKVQIGYNTAKGHWYLANDNNGKYPMDDFPIGAGEGFLMKVASTHTAGVTVSLPPAIEPTDK